MKALIIVDVQYDFLPGGALAVPSGDEVIAVINRLMPQYGCVVATQDWHPEDHGSFASNHEGVKVFDQIELNGLPQTLWPEHCVAGSKGAKLSEELLTHYIDEVVRKGGDPLVDSYSGFFNNGGVHSTGLADVLISRGVTEVDIVGLATDYCVKFTALDALKLGFKVRLIKGACRGVNLTEGDVENALREIEKAGGEIVEENIPELIEIWRPTGKNELAKVEALEWKAWPERLPDQPIFYPVTNERYACEIAERWNTKDKTNGAVGYVTRFKVKGEFLKDYPVKCVGGSYHLEYWIPAEELDLLNQNIVGTIEVTRTFT